MSTNGGGAGRDRLAISLSATEGRIILAVLNDLLDDPPRAAKVLGSLADLERAAVLKRYILDELERIERIRIERLRAGREATGEVAVPYEPPKG